MSTEVDCDPCDFDIDSNRYPEWKPMRDEAPFF
jgi:hypothetical protein